MIAGNLYSVLSDHLIQFLVKPLPSFIIVPKKK